MEETKETIENVKVIHLFNKEDETNEKYLNIEFNGYTVFVNIRGEGDFSQGVELEVRHEDVKEGFVIKANKTSNRLVFGIDCEGFRTETKRRDYYEWLNLERLESAFKTIWSAIK